MAGCALIAVLIGTEGLRFCADAMEYPLTVSRLERQDHSQANAEAVVVLTGPEEWMLARRRVVVAADTQRRHAIPMLICGEGAAGVEQTLAPASDNAVRWIENTSATTFENGRVCASLLRRSGIRTIFLVTDGYHMRRAAMVFRWQGMAVVPVPSSQLGVAPDGEGQGPGLERSWRRLRNAAHELTGLAWYWLRHTIGASPVGS